MGSKEDEKNEHNREMTPEALQEVCQERNMWSQPHLDTRLYLNYKGFNNINGLERYCGVKTLHLGNNNIAKIEGLERMTDLRCLFLEGNRITAIENLHRNLELRQLNLEGNAIRVMPDLSQHLKLEQINLAHNSVETLDDIGELKKMSSLTNVDVSHNNIEETEGVIDFWSTLAPSLRLLRFHANPCVRSIDHYRKRMINALPLLGYLDERPVFPVDRKSSKAWEEGGKEAMEAAKRQHFEEKNRLLQVDPERRELLTRNRKLAIERIEREERERAAQEEERLSKLGATASESSTAVSSGDLDALSGYAAKWRTKVSLYGEDKVREQVAREGEANGGVHARTSAEIKPETPHNLEAHSQQQQQQQQQHQQQQQDNDKENLRSGKIEEMDGEKEICKIPEGTKQPHQHHSFAPPARGAAAAATREEDVLHNRRYNESMHASNPARRPATAPAQGASDFLVTTSRLVGSESREERQFAVLGGDENMDLASAALPKKGRQEQQPFPSQDKCPRGPATPGANGRQSQPQAVMPLIWERNQQQADIEEMKCLDMNFSNARSMRSNDLSSLD